VPSSAIDKTKEHQPKETIVSTLHNKTQKSQIFPLSIFQVFFSSFFVDFDVTVGLI
jgi:hypothetical protein